MHSSTALTPEEYGHAAVKVRQFEESQAGNVCVLGMRPTNFYCELKSFPTTLLHGHPTMCPLIHLELDRRTKNMSEEDSERKRKYENALRRFRLLFASRDRVQRVRQSFHCSRLGVQPRGVQLICMRP